MDFNDPSITLTVGIMFGLILGWMAGRNYVQAKLQELVEKRLDSLRNKTEEKTKKRVTREVREEMSAEIRKDLVEEFSVEARAEAEKAAEKIRRDAAEEAEQARRAAELESRSLLLETRDKAEAELKDRRVEVQKIEERLARRESNLDQRSTRLDDRETKFSAREQKIAETEEQLREKQKGLTEKERDVVRRLETIAEWTAEEAREELKDRMIDQARVEANQRIKEIAEAATEKAEDEARKILSVACQRYAGEFVAEKCVNVVSLPNDGMKGRIIGREGRNIRALEAATGVDVVIDDTPEVVVISSFDPVRREIARRSLEKLISDGRIHPTRIEELVEKTDQEVAQIIKAGGEKAALELGVHGLHSELSKLVGQLQFRTSYGQNMWSHSIEVGFLCGLMASELGVNVMQARRAGLLHDIGKALTHERQESHALVGAELAAKYGETEVVRNAIAAHHNEEPQNSVIAHLVIAADALSGARPGARREILGTYVKRLEDLERISSSFEGVQKSYAIQAGREIRVMVEHAKIDDEGAFALSREIARKIEDELTYPGQIRVTVIRETRATGIAH